MIMLSGTRAEAAVQRRVRRSPLLVLRHNGKGQFDLWSSTVRLISID